MTTRAEADWLRRGAGAATITDVARHAEVSPATVSRVLGSSAKVAPATRARVLAAVEALDYRPSAAARSLRRRTTDLLGLVITDITNPFYPEIVRGAEDEAAAAGRSLLLHNSAEDAAREARYLDVLQEQRIDALIVASSGVWQRHRERLLAYPCPVVLLHLASDEPTVSSVCNDDPAGGRLAAEHLLACGYERVIYIGGPPDAATSSGRYRAVASVLGGDVPRLSSDGHAPAGYEAMMAMARQMVPPFGVIAHNDLTAIGVLSALAELGWAVPDEVGVVGFDDLEVARYVQPALTSVRQDKYRMGAQAVGVALRLLDGAAPERLVIPVTLVRRRSTRTGRSRPSAPPPTTATTRGAP